MGTTSLEGVAQASEGTPLLIFQLYVQRDRDFTASLIRSEPHPMAVAHVWNGPCTIHGSVLPVAGFMMHSSEDFKPAEQAMFAFTRLSPKHVMLHTD